MCGRFAYFGNGIFGYESLHLPSPPLIERYNIAPSQDILVIRTSLISGQAEWAMLHWGLVPFWSKESKTKHILINARAEGIETKPSFRSPFRHRRCVVPASGFYEWMHRDGKQPYFIRPARDDNYFAMAGIWEHWQGRNGEVVNSVAVITTAANKVMAPIHDRMPAILDENNIPEWLDPESDRKLVAEMLKPCPGEWLEAYPVDAYVNNPRHDGEGCITRIET